MLPEICNCISIFPDAIGVLITYKDVNYYSSRFTISGRVQIKELKLGNQTAGSLSIYYKEHPELKMMPDDVLFYIATVITGFISENKLVSITSEFQQCEQELDAIKQVKSLINSGLSLNELLQSVSDVLPRYWQHAEVACCRIVFDDLTYTSHGFKESQWVMKESFVTFDNTTGTIEVFYTHDVTVENKSTFTSEEHDLANTVGIFISRYINDIKGRLLSNNPILNNNPTSKEGLARELLINNDQPLQKLLNEQTLDKYIYLDMMKHKVSQILFVATMYDAFNLEKDDSFFEKFMGQFTNIVYSHYPELFAFHLRSRQLICLKLRTSI